MRLILKSLTHANRQSVELSGGLWWRTGGGVTAERGGGGGGGLFEFTSMATATDGRTDRDQTCGFQGRKPQMPTFVVVLFFLSGNLVKV